MITIEQEALTCDVLVVGGGIAGLMAAIAAAEQGVSVIVADKGDARRSGSGATGNDHFRCYIEEVHGNIEHFLQEFLQSQFGGGGYYDKSLQRKFVARTFECVQDWQRWGIDMKPTGDWEFTGHAFPGRMRTSLKYNGENQKAVLVREALRRGVKIVNKTPIAEYLTNGQQQIIGAVGLDISQRKPALKLFRAKGIISATGNTSRLYPSITGGWMFNVGHCPCNAANGRAAAYRIGAKLVNLEIPNTHAGPKYFSRCGKATWIGVLKDVHGKPVGPFLTKPDKLLGDITSDVWHSVFRDKVQNGTGPVYMDCSEIAQEDMDYMMRGFRWEGDTSLLEAMDQQHIDLHQEMIEFTQYESIMIGRGIQIDDQAATNIPGLFAAGDEVGNFQCGIGGAAVFGRIAGECAGRFVQNCSVSTVQLVEHPTVQRLQQFSDQLCSREQGASWRELNIAIQQLMEDYAGIKQVRSATMLSAGLKYLQDLEQTARQTVCCHDAHELMRTLEAFDLLLIAQLVCTTALERKETRGAHRRSDYTFTNPLLNGLLLTVQQSLEGPVTEWRQAH